MKWLVLLMCLMWVCLAPPARAEVDWPLDFAMPQGDLAIGLGGGLAIGEELRAGDLGGLVCLSASWLDGPFGLHATAYGHRERRANRLGASLEATVWYVLLLGAGVSHGVMDASGGVEVPQGATALTLFAGVPWPLIRLDGGGSWLILPWARPSLRFGPDQAVSMHTQVGVNLVWSTFGF